MPNETYLPVTRFTADPVCQSQRLLLASPDSLRIHLNAAPEATRVYPSVLEHEPDLVTISVLSRWRLGSRGPEGWRDLPSVCRNSETRSSRPRPAAFPVGFCLMRPWRGLSLQAAAAHGKKKETRGQRKARNSAATAPALAQSVAGAAAAGQRQVGGWGACASQTIVHPLRSQGALGTLP